MLFKQVQSTANRLPYSVMWQHMRAVAARDSAPLLYARTLNTHALNIYCIDAVSQFQGFPLLPAMKHLPGGRQFEPLEESLLTPELFATLIKSRQLASCKLRHQREAELKIQEEQNRHRNDTSTVAPPTPPPAQQHPEQHHHQGRNIQVERGNAQHDKEANASSMELDTLDTMMHESQPNLAEQQLKDHTDQLCKEAAEQQRKEKAAQQQRDQEEHQRKELAEQQLKEQSELKARLEGERQARLKEQADIIQEQELRRCWEEKLQGLEEQKHNLCKLLKQV